MQIGMLWYDNSPSDLPAKVARAAEYYLEKYGRRPDTCYINPALLADPAAVDGIQIKPSKYIGLNHIWMGCKEDKDKPCHNTASQLVTPPLER